MRQPLPQLVLPRRPMAPSRDEPPAPSRLGQESTGRLIPRCRAGNALRRRGGQVVRTAIVSTYPPRACGIGAFAADVRLALLGLDEIDRVEKVVIVNRPSSSGPRRWLHSFARRGVVAAARREPPSGSARANGNCATPPRQGRHLGGRQGSRRTARSAAGDCPARRYLRIATSHRGQCVDAHEMRHRRAVVPGLTVALAGKPLCLTPSERRCRA